MQIKELEANSARRCFERAPDKVRLTASAKRSRCGSRHILRRSPTAFPGACLAEWLVGGCVLA